MAVTLIREPGESVFSRNPVVFQFHTDRRHANAGRPYVGTLTFSTAQSADAKMTLVYGDNQFEFIFRVAVDDSGLELPAWDGAETLTAWRDRVLTALRKHYYLARDYTLATQGAAAISITGRENTQVLDLTLDDAVGISLAMNQGGIAPLLTPNLKILAELFVSDGTGGFNQFAQVPLEPDDNGNATWDISEALTTALLASGHDRPNLALPVFETSNKTSREFYIRYAEMYGQPQRVRMVHDTAVKWGVYGGFSKGMLAERTFPHWFVIDSKLKWMDQSTGQRIVKTRQPDYLYTVNFLGALTNVDVRVKVRFSDNTDTTYTAHTYPAIAAYSRVIVPSGVEQLGVHLQDDDKVPAGYEVWLEDGTAVRTEVMTYLINYRHEPYARFFVYENSLGSYEGVYVYGRKSTGYEIVQQSAVTTRMTDFKLEDGERLDFDVRIQDREQVNTGYMTRRQVRGWRDFFLSTDRYAYKHGRYYPITLASTSMEEFTDGNNLFALAFDVGCRYTESLFTADEETDEYSYTPDLSGYIPPPPADPVNFDDRYYLKTQTYNKGEVNALIAALQAAIDAINSGLSVDLTALWAAVNGKASISHSHPEYLTSGDVYELLDGVWTFRGDWVQPDPDEEDSAVYDAGSFVIYEGALWRSTADDNETEPSTPGADWVSVLSVIAYVNNSFDLSTTSSTLDSAYPTAKTGDIVYSEDAGLMWTKLDGGKWTRSTLDLI